MRINRTTLYYISNLRRCSRFKIYCLRPIAFNVTQNLQQTVIIRQGWQAFAINRFYRSMLSIRGTSHGPVSVRLSVTSRSSTKTAKRRITQTTPHDTPKDSSFLMPKISAKFDRGHPLRGRRMLVGWVKIGDF